MKKVISTFAFLFILLSNLTAQTTLYGGALQVDKKKISINKGNTVDIDLQISAKLLNLKSKETLALIPVLKDNSGNTKVLPEIWINGNNREKVIKRKKAFGADLDVLEKVQQTLPAKEYKMGGNISYRTEVPYEAWMKDAVLYINEDNCGCADSRKKMKENDLGRIFNLPPEKYQPKAHVAFMIPQTEAVKNRNEISDAYLDFHVGKYDIVPTFRRNPQELAKVENMISEIVSDDNIVVNEIVFTGKASPEGGFESNVKLSQNRAMALLNYVDQKYKLKREWLKARSVGEDWVGFEKLVNETDFIGKGAVKDIISSFDMPDVKEKKLKSQGTYNYLNQEIFPQLRRVECRVNYTVRGFTTEEGKKIIKTHPKQLSLNELFMIANTYEKGSVEFNEVFETTLKVYPDDPIANVNAAAVAILAKDFAKARSYLNRCAKDGYYYNNLGSIYLEEGNLNDAKTCFMEAQKKGIKEADDNLKEVELKIENNRQFEEVGF